MTVQRAKELLEGVYDCVIVKGKERKPFFENAIDIAIECVEKQIPKKPIGRHTDYKCSVCGRRVRSGKGSSSIQRDNFCQRCGQKLDWEEGGTSD